MERKVPKILLEMDFGYFIPEPVKNIRVPQKVVAPHFCRMLWSWDGQVLSPKSWHRLHAEEAFIDLWRELQRSFGFQITLPRPLPKLQDTGVSVCTHLSEPGEHQFISLGPWTQMGLREEGESLDRILANFHFPPNQRFTYGSEDSPNKSQHLYLLICLTGLRYWGTINQQESWTSVVAKPELTLQMTQVEIQPTWATSTGHMECPSARICLSLYKKWREALWAEKWKVFQQQCVRWRQLSQAEMTSLGITKILTQLVHPGRKCASWVFQWSWCWQFQCNRNRRGKMHQQGSKWEWETRTNWKK